MSVNDRISANERRSAADASGAAQNGAPDPHAVAREETRSHVIARLESLDDLIFAAIDGDAVALDAAADAWREALAELGPEAVEESRQQYLRCAHGIWHALRYEPNHPPHKVFAAIEVISLLADRAR